MPGSWDKLVSSEVVLASFLALLTRSLTTFLFALAALLRFYGNTETEFLLHLTSLRWSFLAFCLGAAALVANLD
jgi:hypothetical protein